MSPTVTGSGTGREKIYLSQTLFQGTADLFDVAMVIFF
jgi:hypothetical protein